MLRACCGSARGSAPPRIRARGRALRAPQHRCARSGARRLRAAGDAADAAAAADDADVEPLAAEKLPAASAEEVVELARTCEHTGRGGGARTDPSRGRPWGTAPEGYPRADAA